MPKVHITHKVKDIAAWKAFDGVLSETMQILVASG